MNNTVTLDAKIKNNNGKASSKSARKMSMIPAIIYGGNKNLMINLDSKQFTNLYFKGKLKSKIIDILLEDNNNIQTIIKEIQLHKVSSEVLHVDFLEVKANSKIKVFLNIKTINEDKSPGVKKGGVVNIVYRKMQFWCDPYSIPESITIDLTGLEIGSSVHINDLKLESNVVPLNKNNIALISISGREKE